MAFLHDRPSCADDGYLIKDVQFGLIAVRIVLQDKDGPCPLIAIVNTLLLRGAIGLPADKHWVSHSALIRILKDYAVQCNTVPARASDEVRAQTEATVSRGLRVLKSSAMRKGMLINPSLSDVSGFEYTPEIAVYDLFRIRLVHGWVIGKDDPEPLKEFFKGKSYNQVQDNIAYLAHEYDLTAGSVITEDNDDDVNDLLSTSTATRSISSTLSSAASCSSLGKFCSSSSISGYTSSGEYGSQEQASLARGWFAKNWSQITQDGVTQLESLIRENEVAVIFRNNHFSTLIKHGGKLYTLMSAAAYSEVPRYVFQRVEVRSQDYGAFDGSFYSIPHIIDISSSSANSISITTTHTGSSADVARARCAAEIRDMRAHRKQRRKTEEDNAKYILCRHPDQRTRRTLRKDEIERINAKRNTSNMYGEAKKPPLQSNTGSKRNNHTPNRANPYGMSKPPLHSTTSHTSSGRTDATSAPPGVEPVGDGCVLT